MFALTPQEVLWKDRSCGKTSLLDDSHDGIFGVKTIAKWKYEISATVQIGELYDDFPTAAASYSASRNDASRKVRGPTRRTVQCCRHGRGRANRNRAIVYEVCDKMDDPIVLDPNYG